MTYFYDAMERLVSVWRGGVLIARYGYDVAGRRIVKRVYDSSTGGTVGYLRMVYAGTQVAFETDSNNTSLSTLYTWGPGVDNLIGMTVGTTSYRVVTDALGSVRALVRRDDGAWMGRLRYDPYGQLIDSAGPQPALRYRWTGREYDAETGIYFHRSRYCDPTVGRFVQEDRAGYAGGGNLYAYVNGNVLQARDPDGQYMMEPYTMDPTRAGNCMEAGGAVVPCGASSPGWGGGGGVSRFGRFVYVWGSFTAWDMLTAFEKNSTGDIEFWDDDDGRIRAAYLEAKRGAYESGDLTAIEVLARAERIGLVIWSGSDIWERNSFSGCGMVAPCTDPAARRITVGTALDHQAVAAFTATHEAPALSVIIAHEIGHLWLGIIGGVYLSDRAIPMENMMRDARGCAIRHGHGDVRLNGGLPGC